MSYFSTEEFEDASRHCLDRIDMAGSDVFLHIGTVLWCGFDGGEQTLQPQRNLEDGGSVIFEDVEKSPPVSATVAQI
jgi:hypothetical protein